MQRMVKIQKGWLIFSACWVCFFASVLLYIRFRLAWMSAFELILEFAVLLAMSAWYVTDRIRYRDGKNQKKSTWVIGPWGIRRRR